MKKPIKRRALADSKFSDTSSPQTNTRKITTRLAREGWRHVGGGRHDKYGHAERPSITIIVPRHREISIGVARDIAKNAGWI